MKLLKYFSFGLLGVMLLPLAAGTVIEKFHGNAYAAGTIYNAPWFVGLWIVIAIASICLMISRKLHRRQATMLLHASFAVILTGAFTSWIWGKEGKIKLQEGVSSDRIELSDGNVGKLPFSISLDKFDIVYYEGTRAPMDFVSEVTVSDRQTSQKGRISMNKIFVFHNYRFYQTGYDSNGESILRVAHDPAGIAVTYAGYTLLLLSFVLFFFDRHNGFRSLLRRTATRKSAVAALLLLPGAINASAGNNDLPPTLPEPTAAKFGDLYVLYNDRICPVGTMAKEFTAKLYGSTSYRGLTAEQVLAGWLFYPTYWSRQPMIAIKSREVRSLLGIDGKYASARDFFSSVNEYKLTRPLNAIDSFEDPRGLREAAEKFEIINSLTAGKTLRLFPYRDTQSNAVTWYAQTDNLPLDMPSDEWTFVRMSISYANELTAKRQWDKLDGLFLKIKKYQKQSGAETIPSDYRFEAEKYYNGIGNVRPVAIALSAIGVIAFFAFCQITAKNRRPKRIATIGLRAVLILAWTYLTVVMALLWYVGGHIPMSNGFETMLFMSWCIVPLSLIASRRMPMALPMGTLLAGLTMLVAMMGESNPRITQLMPVLQSPLLSIHVAVIMIAYSLLAFMALNGVAAIVIRLSGNPDNSAIGKLHAQSRLMLYPAVFLLTAGIFIGAVWANVSWGRYWGWDPKEVWALITMIVYSFAFHTESLPLFRRKMVFHVFSVVAFLTVLFTYFGVNFFLSGMHSYA